MSSSLKKAPRFDLHLLPQTQPGWWSIGLLLLGIALLILNVLLVEVGGQSGGFNPWIVLTIIPAGIAAVAGGVVGLVAMARFRERGALVLIPLIVGALVLTFVIGEVTTPH